MVVAAIAAETATTEASVRRGYGPDLHLSFTPALSEKHVKGLEIQKNFLRDYGFIAGDFDYAGWIDPLPLSLAAELVAEGAVAIPE
jgi:hypothetical protein